jgi:acyl-CoA synthetase (NDP forming)
MHGLSSFFSPDSVAVIGASDDPKKVASIIYSKLLVNAARGTLHAAVYPVNPHYSSIAGRPCYPDLDSLPKTPELLIIAVPVNSTLDLVKDAIRKGVKAIIVIAGGFGEAGRAELEDEIASIARTGDLRILGPNTIGLLVTLSGLDTLFLPNTKVLPDGREVVSLLPPLKGGVVLVTQSGHLGEVVAEELRSNNVGVRAIVGVGNQLDVSVEDVLEHFADDEQTRVIAVYLEGVKQGRRFMLKAAEASPKKPIVVYKMGKTGVGARAALTHTASIVGNYEVYKAAFKQSGLLEADSLEGLVDDCIAFSMLPETKGNRVAILTNAGGTGAIAADESARLGLDIKPLSRQLAGKLRKEFAKASFSGIMNLGNPLDLTATATTDEYEKAFGILTSSEEYDMILAFPTHQPATIDYDIIGRMTSIAKSTGKPIVVGSMGRSELAELFHMGFLSRGVPSYRTPERCVRVLHALAEYHELRGSTCAPRTEAKHRVLPWLESRRGFLPAALNERLLRKYGIPCAKSVIMKSRAEVDVALKALRFPLALKLVSGQLVHKSDVGGVILGVKDEPSLLSIFSELKARSKALGVPFSGVLAQEMVPKGVELILGATRDEVFGPSVVFGLGGIFTEILKDYSVAIGAVSETRALELIDDIRMNPVMNGYRGGPVVDKKKLARVVSSFSLILEENPSISQIEINPLMATVDGVVAVDARTLIARPVADGHCSSGRSPCLSGKP